jgi:hypothetical protein
MPHNREAFAETKQQSSTTHIMSKFVVSETDVLCGRDRLSHGHPGNRTFRRLVDERADTYKRSTNRHQKTNIIRSIIRIIQEAGGRFLTLEDSFLSGNIAWKEMDPQSTHQKVAHALRSKQSSSSVKGSLRGGGLSGSCRSAGNASRASRGSSRAQEAHGPLEPATPKASTTKRQSDLHFLDALIDQQDSLLQNLHISVEFGAKDADLDDDGEQSQCSNASELTSSTSGCQTDDPFPLDDNTEHLVSAEAERLLVKNISEERSTASTYFFTLEGTLAEF